MQYFWDVEIALTSDIIMCLNVLFLEFPVVATQSNIYIAILLTYQNYVLSYTYLCKTILPPTQI